MKKVAALFSIESIADLDATSFPQLIADLTAGKAESVEMLDERYVPKP